MHLSGYVQHFLVDQPAMVAFFEQTLVKELATRPNIHRVGVRFGDEAWEDRLVAVGFNPAKPTVWVCEGLTSCLTLPENRALFAGMGHLSAPGSTLVVDYLNGNMLDTASVKALLDGPLAELKCQWHRGPKSRSEMAAILAAAGMEVEFNLHAMFAPRANGHFRKEHGWFIGTLDRVMDMLPSCRIVKATKRPRTLQDSLKAWPIVISGIVLAQLLIVTLQYM